LAAFLLGLGRQEQKLVGMPITNQLRQKGQGYKKWIDARHREHSEGGVPEVRRQSRAER